MPQSVPQSSTSEHCWCGTKPLTYEPFRGMSHILALVSIPVHSAPLFFTAIECAGDVLATPRLVSKMAPGSHFCWLINNLGSFGFFLCNWSNLHDCGGERNCLWGPLQCGSWAVTSSHQTWQQASTKPSCQLHYLFGSRAFVTHCVEVLILYHFLGHCSTRLRIVACIFLTNKMPFFHNRKLEDFVLRKKQHKEPQWTGRLLFYFLKSIYFFLIK